MVRVVEMMMTMIFVICRLLFLDVPVFISQKREVVWHTNSSRARGGRNELRVKSPKLSAILLIDLLLP